MYSLLLTFLNALSKECEARNFVQPRNTDIMVMVVRLHNLQEVSVDKRWP